MLDHRLSLIFNEQDAIDYFADFHVNKLSSFSSGDFLPADRLSNATGLIVENEELITQSGQMSILYK